MHPVCLECDEMMVLLVGVSEVRQLLVMLLPRLELVRLRLLVEGRVVLFTLHQALCRKWLVAHRAPLLAKRLCVATASCKAVAKKRAPDACDSLLSAGDCSWQ